MEIAFALIGALFIGFAFGAAVVFFAMADKLSRAKKLIDRFIADQDKLIDYQRKAMEAQSEAKRLIRLHEPVV